MSADGGFNWLKDYAIPITAIIVSAVEASWAFIQAQWRKHYFERLIKEEIRELAPTKGGRLDQRLDSHLSKRFVHRTILDNPEKNPEFIFSIDPFLLYNITQLWDAFESNDANRWLMYLSILAFHPQIKGLLNPW